MGLKLPTILELKPKDYFWTMFHPIMMCYAEWNKHSVGYPLDWSTSSIWRGGLECSQYQIACYVMDCDRATSKGNKAKWKMKYPTYINGRVLNPDVVGPWQCCCYICGIDLFELLLLLLLLLLIIELLVRNQCVSSWLGVAYRNVTIELCHWIG